MFIIIFRKGEKVMEKFIFAAWAKAQCAKQTAKEKLMAAGRAFCEEDGEGAGIIVAIILIIIAVALAIIFRDWIGTFVSNLFGQVDTGTDFGDINVSTSS